MRLLARLLDNSGWVFSAVFGFLIGLGALLAGRFNEDYYWLVAIAAAILGGVFCLLASYLYRVLDWGFDKVLFRWGAGTVPPEALKAKERYFRKLSRIAFVVGVLVAFIAGSIFSVEQIVAYL